MPGKATWKSAWAEYLKGVDVYLWQELGAEDLVLRVARDIPTLGVIEAPGGIKDMSEAHIQGHDLPHLLGLLKERAVPATLIVEQAQNAESSQLREACRPVLEHPDPLCLVEEAARELGYGGDSCPLHLTYLAATSRLLAMRHGSMPVHLLLIGAPSAGKSYTIQMVLKLLPPEAYWLNDAGSPRVLIYGPGDLKHRVVVFGEVDSLPSGEDNPAASAVRNLAQDHYLHYTVTIKDPATGQFITQDVFKEGPSVLISSTIRRLGGQLGSRFLELDTPDDLKQIAAALEAQARLELDGPGRVPDSLIAFQGYLQACAPFDVVVPFAMALAEGIKHSQLAPRILRDFQRILSLTKSVAILRHAHRQVNSQGRLVATLVDYATVHQLTHELYEGAISGAGQTLRAVVAAVQEMESQRVEPITIGAVAEKVGLHKSTVSRHVKGGVAAGWLLNTELRKGRPAALSVGEPLPEPAGLPTPQALQETWEKECCSVAAQTDGTVYSHPPAITRKREERWLREPEGPMDWREKT